ncbi:hypothetical protein ACLMJK_001231 [Lecanora helva]
MRITLTTLQIILGWIAIASAASVYHDAKQRSAGGRRHLNERANPPTVQRLILPSLSFSGTVNTSSLPSKFPTASSNETDLHSAQLIDFRVPHSSIELKIMTTHPIDGQILGNSLLAIHEYLNDHIQEYGDRHLAPKDDPFKWTPSGPPRRQPAIALTAQSSPQESMTWNTLLVAVEGVYLALPAVGRDYGCQFDIWDWRDRKLWGQGEVKDVKW